jgi:hypothetical protein
MKKYSYRIIIAGIKEDIEAQCKYLGITDPEYIKVVRQKVDDFKGYQVFAAWLYLRKIEPESIVAALDKYVKSRQLDPSKIKVSKDKKSITIDDKVFEEPIDPIKFTEYIHATYPIMQVEKTNQNVEVKRVDPVIVNKDNSIRIFEVDSADDGRRLVGDDTNWCIGYKGPSNMWQGYRDTKESSFFIVFDNNPPTPNQRKVAIDFTINGVELTDIPNRTGSHLTNGMDWDAYSNYLRKRGINLDAKRVNPKTGEQEKILQNKPITAVERIQKATFETVEKSTARILEKQTVMLWQSGKSELYTGYLRRDFLEQEVFPKDPEQTYLQYPDDRTYFMITIDNPEAKYYTARWMSQGRPFTDEILSFLMKSVGGTDVLVKFLNSGAELIDSQYKIIRENRSLWKTYIRTQIIKAEQTGWHTLSFEYFQDLMASHDDKLITSYLSLGVNSSREFDVRLLRDQYPEYLNLLLHSAMKKVNQFPPTVQETIINSGDKELIEKFVKVAINVTPDIVARIYSDPELFLDYSKAKLALPSGNAYFGETGRKMVDAVLRSGDKEAIKKAALGRGFESRDFALAQEMGVLNEAKFSILNENNIDPYIYKFYDPSNPYDVSLVDQIKSIDTLRELYPEWKGYPRVSMARAITNFEDRPLREQIPLPESDYELMLYLINDKDYMKFISGYNLTDEQKDNLKSLYSELQNSIKDPEFVKTFFKNFPLIKGNNPETTRMFSDLYNNVSEVLTLLPSESLEIPEVKKYVEENIENIKIESLLKHIDVPWLYEAFVERCAHNSELLRTKFNDFYRYDQEFALHFLGDCFEKQKPNWEYFTTQPVDRKIKIATIYFEIYPDEKESRETLSNFFFDSLLFDKNNRSTITQQLYILRNFPKLFYYKIANGDVKTRYIYPEIRSALRQMYPNIANLILQAESETKYGSDYFDEDTEEVVQGKRPEEIEPEIQYNPFDDMPSEEDWPKQASYKLMVKIARKLDLKKNYKLADKFTNILGRYNV